MGTFEMALAKLKEGYAVARSGWNGKGMYVYLVPGGEYQAQTTVALAANPGGKVRYEPYLAIVNVKGTVNTWVPSISDLLAEDWEIILI